MAKGNIDNIDKIKVGTFRKSKSKSPKVEEFDISTLNLNIFGDDEVIEAEPRGPEDAESVRKRLKAKMDMYDEMPPDSDKPSISDLSESDEQSEETTDMTTMTEAVKVADVSETDKDADNVNQTQEVEKNTPPKVTSSTPMVKPTRISARMRRATLAEFHDSYLVKTSTKDGSPITIAPDLVKTAYRICALSGDHKARPTYLINNLLREFFKELEPDIAEWSKLD